MFFSNLKLINRIAQISFENNNSALNQIFKPSNLLEEMKILDWQSKNMQVYSQDIDIHHSVYWSAVLKPE